MYIGVDGCRTGWLAVAQLTNGAVTAKVCAGFTRILDSFPKSAVIAVDIPIGLADAGPRACDQYARRTLGVPRSSSVFPAPLRPVLQARSYEEACRTRLQIEGKKMSRQAWGIVPKVRELDDLLIANKRLRRRVFEVHPEISFAEWAGKPLEFSKKESAGRQERLSLIESVWPGAAARSRTELGRGGYQLDDLYDAFAVLWTAQRIVAGTHRTIGTTQERDSRGLPMQILV
jgi:predicted RNase H-like nuclease